MHELSMLNLLSGMIDANTICPRCFCNKGTSLICSACGFNEVDQQIPSALPYRTILNRQYLIGMVLGKPGGFGITYLALDTRLDLRVAIKEFLPRDLAIRANQSLTVSAHSGEEKELFLWGKEMFLKEARTLARFDHPNVVRVRNVFEENDTAYQVMDYYEGQSLYEYLRMHGGRLPETKSVNIMSHILDGLAEVHRQGFLHRDIKPYNIYITHAGRPILLDFGAARNAIGERSVSLSVMLTPGYAPFEQYHKRGKQGPWTDIYSCAAVLYRMVTGDTPPEATERVDEDSLRAPGDLVPGLSAALSNGIVAGLSIHAAQRPASVSEFRRILNIPPAEIQHYGIGRDDDSLTVMPAIASVRSQHHESGSRRGNDDPGVKRPLPIASRGLKLRGKLLGLKSVFSDRMPTVEFGPFSRLASARVLAIGLAAIGLGGVVVFAAKFLHTPIDQGRGELPGSAKALDSPARAAQVSTAETPAPGRSFVPGSSFRDCDECPEMIVITAGSVNMGSPSNERDRGTDEGPQHSVILPSFAMGKFEITRGQFAAFVKETRYPIRGCDFWKRRAWKRESQKSWANPGFSQTDSEPVVCVSWTDAKQYTYWLSQKTGHTYRLPTEAEWEYSARASQPYSRYWDDQVEKACTYANVGDLTAKKKFRAWSADNCKDNYIYTAPVGTYQPNAFGIHDMLGNVWEWVEDCWHGDYDGAPIDGSAWLGADCDTHPIRGASWVDFGNVVRLANRDRELVDVRGTIHGFRIAMVLPRS